MAKIQTRIFNFGDKNEADWPPLFGTQEKGVFYYDKESGKMLPGYPPNPHPKLAEAPTIIQDSINPFYHSGAQTVVDSRSKLRDIDKACGTITTDKKLSPDSSWKREQEKKRRQDLHESMRKAVGQIDAGTAPMTEETKALCARQNELVSERLGFDAFNVAGSKKDVRGKKYRKRRR